MTPQTCNAPYPQPAPLPPPPPKLPRRHASPLALWHLLSLDAPTVAATWAAFIAYTAGIPLASIHHASIQPAGLHLPLSSPAAIFLAVWMLYAADRLLDAQPLFTAPLHPELQPRHLFHHRHRRAFLRAILLATLPLAFLLHRTPPAVLHLYTLLATLLVVWLLLIHARPAPSAAAHRLPKELAVGLFFPAAVFIPTVARVPQLRPALLPDALLFAALCTLNCLFLYAWEHPNGPAHAHPSTHWAIRHLTPLALTSLTAATLLALSPLTPFHHLAPIRTLAHPAAVFAACALSIALLLTLHALHPRLPPLTTRALADLALLTPLPITLVTSLLPHTSSFI